MKDIRTLASAIALLSGAAAANAADLLSTKDTPATTNLIGSAWNGFYAEVGVGPGFAQTKVAGVISLSEKGTEGTFRLGYDYRFSGTRFALGVFGDVSNSFDVNGGLANIKLGDQWYERVGGKLSYDHGSGQIYVIGGAAWEGFNIASTNTSLNGWSYGVGFNVKIAGPWYAGIELTQTDWGSFTPGMLHLNVNNTDDAVRIFTGVTF